jgi:hypothetical protein
MLEKKADFEHNLTHLWADKSAHLYSAPIRKINPWLNQVGE